MLKKLDLENYIKELKKLFAREKDFIMEGDINIHHSNIIKLQKYTFKEPPFIKNLDTEIMHLKKSGVLSHSQIFEFVKIINYFSYLKKQKFEELAKWFNKIEIPDEIMEIIKVYDKNGELKGIEEIDIINDKIRLNRENIKQILNRIINNRKFEPYLVDRQIHFLNGEDCLLVRGGFNRFIKAQIQGRSNTGFFYIFPDEVSSLKKIESDLYSKKDEIMYAYAKDYSLVMKKWVKFLEFLNREFDKFDHYQARISFAKNKNYEFILPNKSKNIILKNFCHPALNDCKSINLEYKKNILLITGVNAGGKTMLLKSILSSAYMAKYLLPMKCHTDTKIGHFKEIIAIIDDPQSVENNISTFAGRIKEFSKLFNKKDVLIGVDEIELGTDANEAASLFKTIIEELIHQKIVITTHHKRLATLLANNENVELLAAIYDEKNQRPTFDFIQGTIGRSYAFETAQKYGVPTPIITKAKKDYGEDLENLNLLIEKSSKLELELKLKNREMDTRLENIKKLEENLKQEKENFNQNITIQKQKLLKEYNEAIKEAKDIIKSKDTKEAHRKLNKANDLKKNIEIKKIMIPKNINIGDNVKYFNSKGIVTSINGKNAKIDVDGKILTAPVSCLQPYIKTKKAKKVSFNKPRPNKVDIKLDLHGKRFEEAMELTEQFLNNALLANLNEVVITHGMGSGILAKGVKELLKAHPLIKSFEQAPPNMGGMGATLVKL